MNVICLQHYCYSISVMLRENRVDRTQKNVIVLVQSILQLNRSRFSLTLLRLHTCIYTTLAARYTSLVVRSFVVVADGVERIRHRQTTEYPFR